MIPNNAALGEAGELSPSAPAPEVELDDDRVVIETRFGVMRFEREQAVEMPRGIMGFSDKKSFGLALLPDPRMGSFMLLQCLTDPNLSFLLMPLAPDDTMIDRADIENVREALSIAPEDLAVSIVVTIRNVDGAAQVSLNLRAPIFIDISNRSAWQHVLSNGGYPIRYVLEPATEETAETNQMEAVK